MRSIKWIIAYAMVVFTGGTMQSVINIPYPNYIKDGHELTRDIMAGVVYQTALDGIFGGVAMFSKYESSTQDFDFRDAVSTELPKLSNEAVTHYDYNKVREIAWLPALSFSAQAGELIQYNFSPPIEVFVPEDMIVYEVKDDEDRTIFSRIPYGAGYTESETLVFFHDSTGDQFFYNERTEVFTKMDEEKHLLDAGGLRTVKSYGGYIFSGIKGGDAPYFFVGDGWERDPNVKGLATYGPRYLLSYDDNVFDLEYKEYLLFDSKEIREIKKVQEYESYKYLWSLTKTPERFGVSNVGDLLRINPKILNQNFDPETAAKEALMVTNNKYANGEYLGVYRAGDFSVYATNNTMYSSGTIWYTKDMLRWQNSGLVSSGAPDSDVGGSDVQTHNYLYTTKTQHEVLTHHGQPLVGIIKIRLRDNFLYGVQKYIERGRSWQK